LTYGSLLQADVLARHCRRRGDEVRLQTGTDENSLKNVLAADMAGVPVAELVNRNAAAFAALHEPLSLTVDDLVRTSRDARHRGPGCSGSGGTARQPATCIASAPAAPYALHDGHAVTVDDTLAPPTSATPGPPAGAPSALVVTNGPAPIGRVDATVEGTNATANGRHRVTGGGSGG
jgi:hypothetical protein